MISANKVVYLFSKKKRRENKEKDLRVKRSSICITGVWGNKREWADAIFDEMMANNFPSGWKTLSHTLMKCHRSQEG